jgi:hypothetical protein
MACMHSLNKNYDEALRILEEVIKLNHKWKKRAIEDKDFENLRNDEEFIKITS